MSRVLSCNTLVREKLKHARETAHLTQAAVASGVGITRSFYSRVEGGTTACTPELAAKLALYFKGAVSELEILYPERYTGEAA